MGKNIWNLNKEQRIQLKAMICWLGLALLFILMLGQFVAVLLKGEDPEEKVHIPVIEQLTNVWIMEADEACIMIYQDGQQKQYPHANISNAVDVREQIADIVITDGVVTNIQAKTEKINGRILSADESFVEVEGYGKLPLASDYRGYRIYKTLTMCNSSDLHIGYDFADLVIEDGEICGILIVKEESMEYIRVLIKTADYGGALHEQLVLTADTDFTISYGTYNDYKEEQYSAGEEISIDMASKYFEGERITVTPNVLTGKTVLKNVTRSQGSPSYRGHIELLRTEEGIAVVNQVLLEEYLYSVVPSEMPASYPKEALKAQAICARTYAYGHMLHAGYPQYGAHVDDSTSYQVYNNIQEQESTSTAAKETYGQLLYTEDGTLAGTYYYSTSCGVGSDANVWKTEAAQSIDYLSAKEISQNAIAELSELLRDEKAFADFITSKNIDHFEVTEGWYRWTYQVPDLDVERIQNVLQSRYQANTKLILTLEDDEFVTKPIEEFEEIQDMYISKRGAGGVADELIIVTEENTYKVISEHNIRYVLNNGESKVFRQDGSEVSSPTILPSAFFVLSIIREKESVVGYTLTGGGFGHGVGMSQNGAKQMAKAGYSSDDILMFFYERCILQNIYE